MKKLVYLSGPIRNHDHMQMLANLAAFFRAEVMLIKQGYSVINPASDLIARIMAGDFTDEQVLAKDEPLVKRSDANYQLPGWTDSEGATQEYQWALQADVPCVQSLNALHELFADDWISDLPTEPDA